MADDCKPMITAQGKDLARLEERVAGLSERVKDVERDKVDRREYAPVRWVGVAIGAPVILTIVGALFKVVLK